MDSLLSFLAGLAEIAKAHPWISCGLAVLVGYLALRSPDPRKL
jgi:hypothetical protein